MKNLLKKIISLLGYEIKKNSYLEISQDPTIDEIISHYKANGSRPWSSGYEEYKYRYILNSIGDKGIFNAFKNRKLLPNSYGIGIDERCIEYPWLLSQLNDTYHYFLDAGSVFNHKSVIDSIINIANKVHIVTLAPEVNCFHDKGISYFYDDLRALPMKKNSYDAIACLSTVEHIGCDNSHYTLSSKENSVDKEYISAIKELLRVLKPQGKLFISVPFGKYEFHKIFQQFDASEIDNLKSSLKDSVSSINDTYYQYDKNGWQISSIADCADKEYVAWVAQSWIHAGFPHPLPIENDKAAAARAVACLEITK